MIDELNNLPDIFAAFQCKRCFWESCGEERNSSSKGRWHDINVILINQILTHEAADDFPSAHEPNISGVLFGNQIQYLLSRWQGCELDIRVIWVLPARTDIAGHSLIGPSIRGKLIFYLAVGFSSKYDRLHGVVEFLITKVGRGTWRFI